MTSRCSDTDRARNCLAAADRLWERCEKGVDLAFPTASTDRGPLTRKRAARLLFRLLDAGQRLEVMAKRADPELFAVWREQRKARYDANGWEWPPSPDVAKEARMELVQMAFSE